MILKLSLDISRILKNYSGRIPSSLAVTSTAKSCLASISAISGISFQTHIPYSGKVWRGESLANLVNRRRFAKLKPSKLIPTIDNLLADLFIRQTFFRQTLKNNGFAKHSARQTFPLYGTLFLFYVTFRLRSI